jgi:hypothetical protein
MLTHQNLDEFMKMLETRPKTTAIYMKINKELAEGNLYVGNISVQYMIEGHIHAYVVKNVISVQLMPDAVFKALRYYATEDTISGIAANYANALKQFDDKLMGELNDIATVFKQSGFTNIVNAMLA